MALSSSQNPAPTGQNVTFTARVTVVSPGSGTPAGTVDFYNNNRLIGSGPLTVVAGVAQTTFSTSSLAVGSNPITAKYVGSTDFVSSTSSKLTQTISKASPTVKPATGDGSSTLPWQNQVNPLDVVGQGGPIVPADALAVINYLNNNPAGLPLPSTFTPGSDYLDVLGLGTVVPADALQIIDYLNANPAASPAVSPAVTDSSAASSVAPASGALSAVASADPTAAAGSAASGALAVVPLAVQPGSASAVPVSPAAVSPAMMAVGLGGITPAAAAGSGPTPDDLAAEPGSNGSAAASGPATLSAKPPVTQGHPLKPIGALAQAVDTLMADLEANWLK